MSERFADLVDIPIVQELLDSFAPLYPVATAVLDVDGTILAASNWRRICTDFHRANAASALRCHESDTELANGLTRQKAYNVYRCKNGLVDVAVPIIIEGKHLANFFVGQFFFEAPDRTFFVKQAERFRFDGDDYMEALNEVEVIAEDEIKKLLNFMTHQVKVLALLGRAKNASLEARRELERRVEARTKAFAAAKERAEQYARKVIEERKKYKNIMTLASDGLFIMEPVSGKLLEFSHVVPKMLGYSEEEMKNLAVLDWDKGFRSIEEYREFICRMGAEPITFERVHTRKDGSMYDASISAVRMTFQNDDFLYASVRDITEQKRREQEVREKLQKIINTQSAIIVLSDGERLKFANDKFYQFAGYGNLDEYRKEHKSICEHFVKDDLFFHPGKVKPPEANWLESIINLSGRQRVVKMLDSDAVPHAFSVSINPYDDRDYIVSFTDISDTMAEKLQLERQVLVDELTGAYNRIYFRQNIRHILQQHQTAGAKTGVIFLDIDHFKKINDVYGHDTGDRVLKKIVSLMKRLIRNNDVLIRWGGEEFVIFTESESIEGVSKNAEYIRRAVEKHDFKLQACVTCSFGCALHDDRIDVLKTIKKADIALYEAKNGGRNRVEPRMT